MNKDHVDPLSQGNPTGPAQPVGAEERKKDENWRQLTESEKKEYAKTILESKIFTEERKKAFIDDILEVYKKHNLSIAHDSGAGAFIITDIDDRLVNWMKNAELED